MNKKKYNVSVDLDGVLNNYTGEYIPDFIPEIKDGARDFIIELSKEYIVDIFTSRDKNIVKKWLKNNKLGDYINEVTNIKKPYLFHIDDRCIKFEGDYSLTLNQIKIFKPWYINK